MGLSVACARVISPRHTPARGCARGGGDGPGRPEHVGLPRYVGRGPPGAVPDTRQRRCEPGAPADARARAHGVAVDVRGGPVGPLKPPRVCRTVAVAASGESRSALDGRSEVWPGKTFDPMWRSSGDSVQTWPTHRDFSQICAACVGQFCRFRQHCRGFIRFWTVSTGFDQIWATSSNSGGTRVNLIISWFFDPSWLVEREQSSPKLVDVQPILADFRCRPVWVTNSWRSPS